MPLSVLSPELLILILEHCVRARSFKRALRLRLVNKTFAQYTVDAIFQSGIIESDQNIPKLALRNEAAWFWQQYLVRCVLGARSASPEIFIIHNVARGILEHQDELYSSRYTDEQFRACVRKLCNLSFANLHFHLNVNKYMQRHPVDNPNGILLSKYFTQQLLSAAAFLGMMPLVQALCDQDFNYYCANAESIFPFPEACAAYGGHRDIVNLLVHQYPKPPKTDRADFPGHRPTVIRWAGRGGHDDLVDMALSSSWDHLSGSNDALRPLREILSQTSSLSTLRRFIWELKLWTEDPVKRPLAPCPDIQAKKRAEFRKRFVPLRLVKASEHGLQDMVRYLLREVEAPLEFLLGATMPKNYDGSWALHAAAKSGHTEIVQLLLEEGAIVGSAIEHAAKGGSVNTTRLLFEHSKVQEVSIRAALKTAIDREHDGVVNLLEGYGVRISAVERDEIIAQSQS
ncbi:hypothetical protein BT63DRAFT_456721 [Microthyrium microscopicum]|uniref:Uncharacterized protein n=1 Tax=Microthyrium microscopicum TaxID=703497 RepID=A0A6A6U5J6_9PEZI|nr:hypothetical protein BT63DRAFT_456721 [Microthyrium microscopicum]